METAKKMTRQTITETSAQAGPPSRPRRLRRTANIRRMVRETTVTAADLILPLFVVDESRSRKEIGSMPGIFQSRVRECVDDALEAAKLEIPAVLLFGIPAQKDAIGSSSWDPEGPVQEAVRSIKAAAPEMTVIADVCLCEYTDHGHCGVLRESGGVVDVVNDESVELLVKQALSFAEAGADFVAPSDMMDGRIGRIREALDAHGFSSTGIIAYSAKFASGFYGPFREAAESAPKFGDRRSYQMDPANAREAVREILLDIEEGADMVMVKPAMPYLDVICRVRNEFNVPLAAYQVSGEFSMIMAAGRMGWLDCTRAMMESLVSIRRAGADVIITYFAKEASKRL